MPRPVKCRKVCHFPNVLEFLPADDTEKKAPIILTVDEYLSLARQSDDPEVRKEYYGKFQEELAEDPAYAFICYIDANYVADSGIQGISKDTVLGHHGVGIFWNIQDWTIEE